MAHNKRSDACLVYGLRCLIILLSGYGIYGTQTDVACLKKVYQSFEDPNGFLKVTWDFSNKTEGAICRFNGIECWHPDESRMLNIKLTDMGLKGHFPVGIVNCSSLTGLDLSGNSFSGSIPSNMSKLIPYVTTLDLSDNEFSGEIPASLANCSFLNDISLDSNHFSGRIPLVFGSLGRLKSFSVANNFFYGEVPTFDGGVKENYANNPGLCGKPLTECVPPQKSHLGFIAGGAAGGLTFVIVLAGIAFFYISRMKVIIRKKQYDPEGNRWAKSMKKIKAVKVSVFEKLISKMSLDELMKATNSFSSNNIIGSGRTGTMYKALMPDGTLLMVKRSKDSQRTEEEFLSEMNILGSVKHQNLVPLLGFCAAKRRGF